jgi:hypothetical protein
MKGRIPPNALSDLHTAIADPKTVLQHVPLAENVAIEMRDVSNFVAYLL